MLKVGDPAPDFELPDQMGTLKQFSKIKGESFSVLFFYPKDHSPGCSAQSCSFRDNYAGLKALGAQVIGISADSPESHLKFASNNKLPYPLLSDVNGVARKLYGVSKTFGILPGRATFVVDQAGIIRFAFSSQLEIQRHVDDAIAVIKSLSGQSEKTAGL
jgi:peroxiredoxin Q/BCP